MVVGLETVKKSHTRAEEKKKHGTQGKQESVDDLIKKGHFYSPDVSNGGGT